MYAVIRAGGKQYRVAPGDVIRVEKTGTGDSTIEFSDVLAVSGSEGAIARPQSEARVVGQVVEEGRGDKVLVEEGGSGRGILCRYESGGKSRQGTSNEEGSGEKVSRQEGGAQEEVTWRAGRAVYGTQKGTGKFTQRTRFQLAASGL